MAERTVYVVTGGGRGIGRAVAQHLVGRGSAVLLVDVGCLVDGTAPETSVVDEAAETMRDAGGDVVGDAGDVRDRSAMKQAIHTAVERWGRVDGVVNAAAILRMGNVVTMTDDDWHETLAVNVEGTLNVSRAAIRHWLDTESRGSIVTFTSTAGLEGIPDMLAYSTSKAAVIGLTMALANGVLHRGITVNAVAPLAATRMAIRGQSVAAIAARNATGSWPSTATAAIPAEHVGPLCAYLLSPAAASVTGRVFTVAGPSCGRLSLPSPECTVVVPPDATGAEEDTLLASTLGADLGSPSRWVVDELAAEPDGFPVAELG
jgi:NAD(P)-dependent dehydrogenase (short-subunit alcohol dehydrogenase family)